MNGPDGRGELIGRDAELRAFERILDANRPAVLLVTGPVGSGKSRLLRELRHRAEARGWRAVAPAGEPAFVVTRDATPWSFAARVQEALAAGARDDGIQAGPALDAYALSRGVAASAEVPPPPAAVAGDELAASLVEAMRGLCPALVLVDGYRPNTAFRTWLAAELMPTVGRSGLPVVSVLTLESEPWPDVLRYADAHFPLDRLDEAATERYFREIGRRLRPSMDDEELREYVKAAAARPELIHDLRRVLALAERQGR
jgi:AAA ATPase domain